MGKKGKVQTEPKIIGTAYQKAISIIEKYAEDDLPVIFVGETGSGKELFAKKYINWSKRRGDKITVNCAAYPEELLRSEVFGHVKGAFTGALRNRPGFLKTCENGILFLDELGDASLEFQAAILRVSELYSFSQLGSDKEAKVDTLIIAATNRPNQIRSDLKMRFNIVPIPPLKKFDIPVLTRHFLGKPLKEDILKELIEREYTGNIRELKNTCEELHARQGDNIFSKKESSLFLLKGDFDYDRYEREVKTWEKYIGPLIQKYRLGFKYKYFEVVKETRIDIHDVAISMHGTNFGEKLAKKVPDVIDLIDNLNAGIEQSHFTYEVIKDLPAQLPHGVYHERVLDVQPISINLVPIFYESMSLLFREEGLPFLLEKITERFDRKTVAKDEKPNLSPLLDLKADDASNQFELAYLQYHLNASSGNMDQAAKKVGLNQGTFKTRLRRVKKEIQKSKEESNIG